MLPATIEWSEKKIKPHINVLTEGELCHHQAPAWPRARRVTITRDKKEK